MIEIPSARDRAILTGDFETYTPDELFEHFVVPELLVKWWPEEAHVEPRVGGRYHFTWPGMGWNLRGEFLAFEPGQRLSYTWNWDHDPGSGEPMVVDIHFAPIHDAGTRIAIYHGPFRLDAADQEARQGIIEGWIHFGMRLAGLKTGTAP